MPKIPALLVIVVVLIIAGVGIYKSINKPPSPSQQTTSIQPGKPQSLEYKPNQINKYVEYSKANLDLSSNTKRILFFYANWCPTCKPADENFKANLDKIPDNTTIIRVNYNDTDTDQEEKELAKKYAITYQHTFVQIDSNGNEITKWNGGKIDELLKNII